MNRSIGLSLALLATLGLVQVPAAAQDGIKERVKVGDDVFDRDRPEKSRTPERERVRQRKAARSLAALPRGTDIAVTLDEDVPVERDRFGDTFEAHVERDVMANGRVAIPAGAPAKVKLVESSEKNNAATLRLSDVRAGGEMREVTVGDARADVDRTGMSTGEKTAVGAAAGAIVGAVTGAGVLEGAVVGAGGGLAWGLLSDRGREINDGTTLRFELEEKLDVR